VILFCDVSEAVLTDRGTNLLSLLMLDICSYLRITLSYHPECDGMVKRGSHPSVNMLTSLECNGISNCLVYYGHTETHLMRALVRSHVFFNLVRKEVAKQSGDVKLFSPPHHHG